MSSKAVFATLQHVDATLEAAGVDRAVIGGLALAAWKHPRATQDVDLLIDVVPRKVNELLRHLRQAGFRTRHNPPISRVGEHEFIQLLYEPPDTYVDLHVDLLLVRSDFQFDAIQRRCVKHLPTLSGQYDVLTCEDIVILKLLGGRLIDRADGATLLRLNRDTIDVDYLVSRIHTLRLTSGFAEIWDEAFPGERAPVHYDEE